MIKTKLIHFWHPRRKLCQFRFTCIETLIQYTDWSCLVQSSCVGEMRETEQFPACIYCYHCVGNSKAAWLTVTATSLNRCDWIWCLAWLLQPVICNQWSGSCNNCCFVDLNKAFYSVPHSLLWSRLTAMKLHPCMIHLLQSYYAKCTACVQNPYGRSYLFSTKESNKDVT